MNAPGHPLDPDLLEELTGAGSFTHDLDSQATWLSPQLRRLLGLRAGPEPASFCELVHGDDASAVASLMTSIGPGEVQSVDCRVRVAPDSSRRLQLTLRRSAGVAAIIGVVRDVSDARRDEERLRAADADAPIGPLTAGVVHDVNNLIAAATLNLARVRRIAGADVDLAGVLDDIDGALLRAGTLARHLLGAAQRDPREGAVCQVADVVRGVESLLRRVIPRRIDFLVEAPSTTAPVNLDPLQFERVLINLVLNARDAIDGAGTITVTVSESSEDRPCVRIVVADNGHGMDAATRAAIGEGTFSSKPAASHFGLGLAVVRSVVEQARGHLAIDSAPGVGSRFTLVLPSWPPPPRCP